MKKMYLGLMALAMGLLCGAASAQTTVNSTSNSSVSSGAQSSAANQGNAQSITFNTPQQPTRTTQRVVSAPSLGLGSFGSSFSSDNCSNTIAGQLSVVGIGASAGRALLEENCAHLRRGYAFGQAAAFAAQNHQPEMAAKMQAMVNFEFCTTDPQTQAACTKLGLIVDGNNQKETGQAGPSFGQAHIPQTNPGQEEAMTTMPHDASWTNAHWVEANKH